MADTEVVITAGGVGPTVDDVTIKAVARAFDTHIVRNTELEASLRERFGEGVRATSDG